jgi:hypothetical protein
MSSKRPRKHLDQKLKYVGLPHWLLKSAAWKALPATAKVAYIEAFELSYNGVNNGDIKLSEREVAEIVGCARETASKALGILQTHGFVKPRVKGQFHVKVKYATRWILNRYEHLGEPPTMDFMRWRPGAEEKRRDQNLGQMGLGTRPDGPESSLSGLVTRPDRALSEPPTGLNSRPVLVYQGRRSRDAPRGSQQQKAAWLRDHLEAGVVTNDTVASTLAIRTDQVDPIAAGKVALANTSWQKIAALVASTMN